MLCHTERGGASYAGGRPIATPFGTVFSSNLTPDANTGIGTWSAAHFRRALHEGRSRDGRLLYPAFPYNHTTYVLGTDAGCAVRLPAQLPAVDKPNLPHRLRWPYNTQAALAVWRGSTSGRRSSRRTRPHARNWNRGAYLVRGIGHCGACHTARNALGGMRDAMDLSGG
jgi:mono/diheme cytochrome c family protein